MIDALSQLMSSGNLPLYSLVESLSSQQAAQLLQAVKGYLPWTPLAGPQAMAYISPADELFFGGKAGAGKSDLLLGLGLTQHRKTLILRREATQLQEITSRLREVLKTGDKFRGSGYGGVCTTHDGRILELAGCEHETDKQKYKGRAHDLKAWDEVVDFPESVYLFVNGWNRTTVKGQRCRVVCASNPPTTAEGEWVIRRWRAWLDNGYSNRAAPGELRYYTTIGDKEEEFPSAAPVEHEGTTYYPRSRTFIPGDMIELLKATGYANTLATLPEPLRSIYLKGDFGASKQDDRWQLIPSSWVELAQKRWKQRQNDIGSLSALGVDVAMEGSDWGVIARRYGATIANLVKKRGKDIPDGATMCRMIVEAGGGSGGIRTNIDAIGVGKSAYDSAKLLGLADVYPVVVSESTSWKDPKIHSLRFVNLRAAMMWKVRSLLDPEGGDEGSRLALPPDAELAADLCAPRYELKISGIQVESKDEIRKRIGRSTDSGDSVALACWEPEAQFIVV